MHARIASIRQGAPGLNRLLEMGLTPGAEFKVVKVAPFGDPIELDLRGYRLCLRKHEAEDIEVEIVD